MRKIGERAVKLEGNPLHPVNGGRLCPKGHAGLQGLYHPDRVPGPLRRVGPRGSLRSFERTSWDERARRDRGAPAIAAGPEAPGVACASPERNGRDRRPRRPEVPCLVRLAERRVARPRRGGGVPRPFPRAGSARDTRLRPAVDRLRPLCRRRRSWKRRARRSTRCARTASSARAGRDGAASWSRSSHGSRSTAASADEWIAVRPGTEGIFALGVAGVIVAEGLYDRQFVQERTSGFEEARDGRPSLRSLLEKHYGLERVASETGISVNVILRVAREFAAARSRLAIGPRRGPLLPGRLFDHLAAQVLNALAGSIDTPGGVLVPEEVPLAKWPPFPPDPIAAAGRAQASARRRRNRLRSWPYPIPNAWPRRFCKEFPTRPTCSCCAGSDPIFASAAPTRLLAALERVPLVVSFSSIPDDTALHADWILPDAHFLERWDLAHVASRRPVPGREPRAACRGQAATRRAPRDGGPPRSGARASGPRWRRRCRGRTCRR